MTVSLKLFCGDGDVVRSFRIGSRLDKYRLIRRLGHGGFSTVYAALDQIENRQVALKVPEEKYVSDVASLEDLQREVRIMAKLDHPNILQLKDARFIDGRFVMVFPLGLESLDSRLQRRIARQNAFDFATQMIEAVAFAHGNKVLHRDIKPDNFVLFRDNQLRLTDFGLARIHRGRVDLSASGTLGYMAPEQAMGKPSFRSDVFSLGLVLYRLFSGELPSYPFASPLPGLTRMRRSLHVDFLDLIRKSIDPNPTKRFRDAVALKNAMAKIRNPLRELAKPKRPTTTGRKGSSRRRDAA
ncbi:MAG: serine/threonine protein kinase [Planctomycetaceae bacterium]|nr:MAG: serine/threonine protein kinase [Planctomycetaceae bacterium]